MQGRYLQNRRTGIVGGAPQTRSIDWWVDSVSLCVCVCACVCLNAVVAKKGFVRDGGSDDDGDDE